MQNWLIQVCDKCCMENWYIHVCDKLCMENWLIQVCDKGVVCKTGSIRCEIRGCM